MLQRVSSSELTELLAFVRQEPVGGPVEDYRAGLSAAVQLNLNRREGAAMVNPLELFPWDAPAKPALEDEPPEVVAQNVRRLFDRAASAAKG